MLNCVMKTSGMRQAVKLYSKLSNLQVVTASPVRHFYNFLMGPGEKFCNQAFDANLVATLGKAKNNLPRVQCRNIIHIFCRIFTNKRRFVFCKSKMAGISTANSLLFSRFLYWFRNWIFPRTPRNIRSNVHELPPTYGFFFVEVVLILRLTIWWPIWISLRNAVSLCGLLYWTFILILQVAVCCSNKICRLFLQSSVRRFPSPRFCVVYFLDWSLQNGRKAGRHRSKVLNFMYIVIQCCSVV